MYWRKSLENAAVTSTNIISAAIEPGMCDYIRGTLRSTSSVASSITFYAIVSTEYKRQYCQLCHDNKSLSDSSLWHLIIWKLIFLINFDTPICKRVSPCSILNLAMYQNVRPNIFFLTFPKFCLLFILFNDFFAV